MNCPTVNCPTVNCPTYGECRDRCQAGGSCESATDPLRERLIEYVTRLHVPRVKPVNGVITIPAEDMADALLPFVREELANRPPTQDAYDAACKALWTHRARAAELKDLLGSIWLYVNWRYVTTQLTTEQKELWADAVDAMGEDGDRTVDRWWR